MPKTTEIILGEKHNVANIAATLAEDVGGLAKILRLPPLAIDRSGMVTTVNIGDHKITYFGEGEKTIKIHGTKEAAGKNYGQQTLLQVLQSQGYIVPQLG